MHVVRSLATGGTERVVRTLVSAMDPSQFRHTLCTLVASPGEPPPETICLGRAPDKPAFLVPQLARIFRRERPDIVHSRNWATVESVLAAKLAGIGGIVHSEHGRDLNTMGRQPWRRRIFRRLSYACADRVFCVSEELRQYYCQQLGMKPATFDVIPNGVDTVQFRPCPEARTAGRAHIGATNGTLVVGTVARLDPVKDHLTLLRAADIARGKGVNLILVIVGDGNERRTLEAELSRRPDLARSTVLSGEVSNVAEWLNTFDIFVLPSLSEGMSNTLLEAMATGVVPVATAVGGNGEVIEDGRSGLLVAPRDADQISSLIVRLAASAEQRQELGRNARQRVIAQFSLDRTLKRYEEMYCALVNSNSKRSQQVSIQPQRMRS